MHKKGFMVGGTMSALILTVLVLGSNSVFADVTCGEPDANTGLSVCTDSSTGATTYKRVSSATASVTVSTACSFSRGQEDTGEYSGTLANGATPTTINGSTFTTTCNDSGGSAIYAVGYSNNELSNTDLISSLGSDSNIHTAAYDSSASTHDSSWAMKLENAGGYATATIRTDTGYDFSDFHAVPSNYTMVASYPSTTIDPTGAVSGGSMVRVIYQAYASYTQPAGTYTGQVKYTMVHPNNAAMPTIDDLVYMQDFAVLTSAEKANVIESMAVGGDYTLEDARDNTVYHITVLDDGKIWMTNNLALAAGTALTSGQSNVSADYTIPTDTWSTDSYTGGLAYTNSGVWYNYCAASAGTVCEDSTGENADAAAEYDICPAGWRLPTSTEQSAITSYTTSYGPTTGGYYSNGALASSSNGYWWSANAASSDAATNRGILMYNGTTLAADSLNRGNGAFIRCVAN